MSDLKVCNCFQYVTVGVSRIIEIHGLVKHLQHKVFPKRIRFWHSFQALVFIAGLLNRTLSDDDWPVVDRASTQFKNGSLSALLPFERVWFNTGDNSVKVGSEPIADLVFLSRFDKPTVVMTSDCDPILIWRKCRYKINAWSAPEAGMALVRHCPQNRNRARFAESIGASDHVNRANRSYEDIYGPRLIETVCLGLDWQSRWDEFCPNSNSLQQTPQDPQLTLLLWLVSCYEARNQSYGRVT